MASSESSDRIGSSTTIDPRQADALYKPFPPFSEWANCSVDTTRLERYATELDKLRVESPDELQKALEIVKRAAAVDTGAIEGLYNTDRGFTFTVALQSAHWEAVLASKGSKVVELFQSQLNAYDYVLDFATQQVPIAEAWIRRLHAEVCRSQNTYEVLTELGFQDQVLPKGEYKQSPNHVIQVDGTIHAYAPVDMTPMEMYRFCEELRGERFLEAHPVLQAAYSHYAFVVIHPFADGNGRVARALASVFTYRSQSVPLLMLVDTRDAYLATLRAADNEEYQPFVNFILENTLDAIQLTNESLRVAALPPLESALADLKGLYVTRGGYTHAEVDEAGYRFFELFRHELIRQLEVARDTGGVIFRISDASTSSTVAKETSRWPVASGKRELDVRISSSAPADASVRHIFLLEVPKDCGRDDDFVIQDRETHELVEARISELFPRPTTALEVRLKVVAEAIVNKLIRELTSKALASRRQKGY